MAQERHSKSSEQNCHPHRCIKLAVVLERTFLMDKIHVENSLSLFAFNDFNFLFDQDILCPGKFTIKRKRFIEEKLADPLSLM
jgi:hypothetical protein